MKLKTLLAMLALASSTLSHAAAVPLINAGFENDWDSSATGTDGKVTFYYSPTGGDMGWIFQSAGVANNYSLQIAAEGKRFGFLQTTSSMSQTFTLDSPGTVDLSFALALRPEYSPGQNVDVSIDDVVMGNFKAKLGWNTQTVSLGLLAAGTHTLKLSGMASMGVNGDTTAYIDSVQLSVTPVPEPETYALMLAGLGMVGWAARRAGSA